MLVSILLFSLLVSLLVVTLLPIVAKANGTELQLTKLEPAISIFCCLPIINVVLLLLAIRSLKQ